MICKNYSFCENSNNCYNFVAYTLSNIFKTIYIERGATK